MSFCFAQPPVDEMFGGVQREDTLKARDFNSTYRQKTYAAG